MNKHCIDCGKKFHNLGHLRCLKCYRAMLDAKALAAGKDLEKLASHRLWMRNYMRNLRTTDVRQWQDRLTKRRLQRLRYRFKPRICSAGPEVCMYAGYEHHHCECGLVLAPSEFACPMCIAEQSRIEFKIWPLSREGAA